MTLAPIEQLIKKRDEAHKTFVDSQNARQDAWQAFQTAQDELAEAIFATSTDTYIDEAGSEHKARRGGFAQVLTTKARPNDRN